MYRCGARGCAPLVSSIRLKKTLVVKRQNDRSPFNVALFLSCPEIRDSQNAVAIARSDFAQAILGWSSHMNTILLKYHKNNACRGFSEVAFQCQFALARLPNYVCQMYTLYVVKFALLNCFLPFLPNSSCVRFKIIQTCKNISALIKNYFKLNSRSEQICEKINWHVRPKRVNSKMCL